MYVKEVEVTKFLKPTPKNEIYLKSWGIKQAIHYER